MARSKLDEDPGSEDAATEEALHEVDHGLGCPVLIVADGVQLDDVEGSHQPAIGKNLHEEMRLSEVHSSANRRRNAAEAAGSAPA